MKSLGLLVTGTLLLACSDTAADAKSSKAMRDSEVCVAAHQAAKSGLKAPATAKFPDSFCELLTRKSTVDPATGHTVWTISGPVDSENSFGALVRSTYTVEIEDMGDGDNYKYRVISIE